MTMHAEEDDLPTRLADGDGPAAGLLRRFERQTPVPLTEAEAWDRTLSRLASGGNRLRLRMGVAAACGALIGAVALQAFVAPRRPAAPAVVTSARPSAPAAPAPQPQASLPPAPRTEVPQIALGRAPVGLPLGRADLLDGARVLLSPDGRARASASEGTATIELAAGTLDVAVEKRVERDEAFEVIVVPYRFAVLGARFQIGRTSRSVTLSVSEGRVEVFEGPRSVAVVADGRRWVGPAGGSAATRTVAMRAPAAPDRAAQPGPGPVSTLEPPPFAQAPARTVAPSPRPPSAERAAAASGCRARAAHEPRDGLACYLAQAAGSDLHAEVALYEAARLRRDALADPAGALETLREHRRRFPSGTLGAEVELSIAELLPKLGRYQEALDEATALLAGHPHGERAGELQLLRGHVLREGFHDCAGAERAYAAAAASGAGRAADPGAFWRAVCLETLGRRDEARLAYAQYLVRPAAALAPEARRRLAALGDLP